MKRNTLLILSAFTLLMASCGSDSTTTGLMIPKDADMVVHVNTASLLAKVNWDEIKQNTWFNKSSENDSLVKQLLDNPASSGIDIKSDIFFYTKKQGNSRYAVIEGSLADAAAFEILCKNINKKEPVEIKKEKGFSYITSGHGAVVWTNKYFSFTSSASRSYKSAPGETTYLTNKGLEPDSLKVLGMEALTVDTKNNLDDDDRFATMKKDGGDIHLWIKSKNFASAFGGVGSLLDLATLFEGNATAVSLNFENGKISAKLKQYYGEKMDKLMSGFKAGPVTAASVNRIPSSNVMAVVAFNYPPPALKEFLKIAGKDAMVEMMLANLKTSTDEFIKSNKGEVVLSLSKPATAEQKTSKSAKDEDDEDGFMKGMKMKILFANSVNDEATFGKVVSSAEQMITQMKNRGGAKANKEFPFSYKLQNNWFALSNSPELTDQFLTGGDTKHPFTDKITGHPFGLYVDLRKIMQSTFGGADTNVKKMFGTAMNMWEDVVATGGEYKDNATQFDIAVNLTDKNTNSLKQLLQFFSHAGSLFSGRLDVKEVTIEDISLEEDRPEPPPPPPAKKKSNN